MLMAPVCPTRPAARDRPGGSQQALGISLGSPGILVDVTDEAPLPEPPSAPRSPRRRRVFQTAGLTASAAVLALSIQAGSLTSDGDQPVNQYGDATILDPDATDQPA